MSWMNYETMVHVVSSTQQPCLGLKRFSTRIMIPRDKTSKCLTIDIHRWMLTVNIWHLHGCAVLVRWKTVNWRQIVGIEYFSIQSVASLCTHFDACGKQTQSTLWIIPGMSVYGVFDAPQAEIKSNPHTFMFHHDVFRDTWPFNSLFTFLFWCFGIFIKLCWRDFWTVDPFLSWKLENERVNMTFFFN